MVAHPTEAYQIGAIQRRRKHACTQIKGIPDIGENQVVLDDPVLCRARHILIHRSRERHLHPVWLGAVNGASSITFGTLETTIAWKQQKYRV